MYAISKYKNIKTTSAMEQLNFCDIGDLLDWFEKMPHVERSTKDGLLIGMFSTTNNESRKKENITSVCAITLDIDETNRVELEAAIDKMIDFNFIIYTTYSHTPENPRMRIIVPLDVPVSPKEYEQKRLASRLAQKIGFTKIDDVSNRPSQIYYTPAHPKFAKESDICINHGSKTLSLADIPSPAKSVGSSTSSNKESADHDAVVAEATRITKENFNGNIHFISGRFYIYENGIWREWISDEFLQHMLRDVYQLKQAMGKVQKTIEMVQVLSFQKEFPVCTAGQEVIVLQNCAVSPKTGEVLNHSPDHFARNSLAFDYDQKATCPLWEKFLADVWQGDPDLTEKIMLLQEFMGYSLIPSVKFQKMIWLIGSGANGKSVILDILRELVGTANVAAVPFAKFNQRFTLAQLHGKLINISAEISTTAVLADSELKSIVAGDIITLERKMEHPFATKLSVKLWAAANTLPKTKDHSHGFFRRIVLLPFNRVFTPAEQDKDLSEKLTQELPGIFNWALQGLHRLQENDEFTVPVSSVNALEEYKTESNSVALFLKEHLTKLPDENASPSAGTIVFIVYTAYKNYCRAYGYGAVSNSELGKRLSVLGIKSKKSNGKTFYPVKVDNTERYDDYSHRPPLPPIRTGHNHLEEEFNDM